MEEIGELITASAKPHNEKDHFVEEMADVAIMIEQVVYLLKKESLFVETREKKIGRQIKRIEEERTREKKWCCECKHYYLTCFQEPCKNCFNTKMRSNWEKDEK
jgi:NTP pyrophosphatase (non-canonical NTP hydrolase)